MKNRYFFLTFYQFYHFSNVNCMISLFVFVFASCRSIFLFPYSLAPENVNRKKTWLPMLNGRSLIERDLIKIKHLS